MKKALMVLIIICAPLSVFALSLVEEKAQRPEAQKSFNMFSRTQWGLSTGFDSNVRLDQEREGDVFEKISFAQAYSLKLCPTTNLRILYSGDYTNYSEVVDASSLWQNLELGLHKRIGDFTLGTGYDFKFLYFPENREGNNIIHEPFFYIRHRLTPKLSQRIFWHYGMKDYLNAYALDGTATAYQEKTRFDRKHTLGYELRGNLDKKNLLIGRTKLFLNDSNARFQDYYDYKAYFGQVGLRHFLTPRWTLLTDFSFQKKNYTSRQVTAGGFIQRDKLYSATSGVKYMINSAQALDISYTYKQNVSNDHFQEYSENIISCSLQYNF